MSDSIERSRYCDASAEVISPDFGGIWFSDSPCVRPWLEFQLVNLGPYTLFLVNNVQNSGSCCTTLAEAMYVAGDVLVEPGTTLDLNGFNLYYSGALDAPPCPGPAFPGGCPTGIATTLYGDFNADCQITSREMRALQRIIDGIDPYAPLFDLNCDGAITKEVEFARFQDNMKVQPPCAAQEASGGIAGPPMTPGECAALTTWLPTVMTPAALTQFAVDLHTTAGDFSGTELAQELDAFAVELSP